jgi:hypothetical protein
MTPDGALPKVQNRGVFRQEMVFMVVAAGADQHLARGLRARFAFTVLMPDKIELTRHQDQ